VHTVTFDFWNTLLATGGDAFIRRRADQWVADLAEAGHLVTADAVMGAFAGSWAGFQAAWKANRQYVTTDGVDRVLELLELQVEAEVREQLIARYREGSSDGDLTMAPNLVPTLAALKAAGIRIGIICDVGLTPSTTLRGHLDRFGVLDAFDHFSFSDEVGVYKPDPAIFAHALEGLGGEPASSVHIGDLRRTDVAGARGAGWTAVRYTGLHDDDGTEDDLTSVEGHHVLADHAQLPEALDLD
jgi:putative hydrolase of the HAD superfamily